MREEGRGKGMEKKQSIEGGEREKREIKKNRHMREQSKRKKWIKVKKLMLGREEKEQDKI